MADIFISYAREDETRIRELVLTLEKHGWSIFWDRRIPAGKTWDTYIGQALSEAKCVIVAWSHHSITSEWVKEEANDAKERDLLIPILLDSVKPPLGFRGIQSADLTAWKPGHSSLSFDQLILDIGGVVGGKPHQPTPEEELTPQPAPEDSLQRSAVRAVPRVKAQELTANEWFEKAHKAVEPEEQERCLTEAIRLKPGYYQAYASRGVIRHMKGDLDGALSDFDTVIRLKVPRGFYFRGSKPVPLIHYLRGCVREDKGDLDGALADFKEATRLKPDFKEAQANCERIELKGKWTELNGMVQNLGSHLHKMAMTPIKDLADKREPDKNGDDPER